MSTWPLASSAQVVVVEDHPSFREALIHAIESAPDLVLAGACKDLPEAQRLVESQCPDILLVDLGLPNGSGLKLLRLASYCWPGRCTSALLTVTGTEENLLAAVEAGAKGYLFKSDQPSDWLNTIDQLRAGQSPLHAQQASGFLQRLWPADNTVAESIEAQGMGGELSPPEPIAPSTTVDGNASVSIDLTTKNLLQHLAAGYHVGEAAARMFLSEAEAGQRIRAVYDRFFQSPPSLSPRELELIRLLGKGLTFRQCAQVMGVGEATTKTQASRAYHKLGANNLQSALYEARQAGLLH